MGGNARCAEGGQWSRGGAVAEEATRKRNSRNFMTKLTNPGFTLFACHVIGLNAMVHPHAMRATLLNILVKMVWKK